MSHITGTYEVTLRGGRVFEVNTTTHDGILSLLDNEWCTGRERNVASKPNDLAWLPRFKTSEVESFRRIA